MKSDIQISRETELKPISEIAAHIDLSQDKLIPFGHHKAKIPLSEIKEDKISEHNMILVTAITPTKAGIGKTTTSVGLALGLEKIGKRSIVALREPSLGPCFGMKGGAAGGGYAQVLPMEDINLHFTGDFHAVTAAHNMISAMLDNYQHSNRQSDKQLRQVLWRRVLDVNDRALRSVATGLGGNSNGVTSESGFDITAASEIMAVLCLASDLQDLRKRIDSITLGYTVDRQPFTVADLGVGGAVTVLLKDALLPNLVQTTEHTAAMIHGGPFANIAHGCNSVIATKMALSHSEYVITEAGFGADLGAEKFFNIKCRATGLTPKVTVIVVTSQALKLHGEVPQDKISEPNKEGLEKGLRNLERHLQNVKSFGQSVVVAFNQYGFDTEEEIAFMRSWCADQGVRFALNNGFTQGGKGAEELAEEVVKAIDENPSGALTLTYDDEDDTATKIRKVAQNIYRADSVSFGKKAQVMLRKIKRLGLEGLPICIAKTQYSFSDDPKALGAASGFELNVEDLVINTGAGFIVVIAGSIMRMPGLPKVPAAMHIDLNENGEVEGLS